MKKYEKETGKKAIWHGNITKSFEKWQMGEKIYRDDKIRISMLLPEKNKNEWQKVATENNLSSISRLIRDSVKLYMNIKSKKFDFEDISKITHYLKEPLTSINGFSEMLIEDHKEELSCEAWLKVRNILNQSLVLGKRIDSLTLDKIINNEYCDVLIIDDDFNAITLLSDFFKKNGYKCEEVMNGKNTLEFLKTSKPKLILLDIILPDISGYEICKTIKSNKKLKDIPVYYITAVNQAEVKKKTKETGAQGYFLKPFNFNEFKVLFDLI
ncbi:hypothetical protein LCGC14_0922790 [marine sediment metagenome]|uniref:Response regulatory domain-containing protein n=1 Tax=marine sediment metagenome TaxID=412755 RepID=A0A0F9NV27_9ZZZZ